MEEQSGTLMCVNCEEQYNYIMTPKSTDWF